MPAEMRAKHRPWPAVLVAMAVAATLVACRALGFGEGVLLGATPASGIALAAALMLRGRGVLAVVAGFAIGGAAWGLAPGVIAADTLSHAAGAWAGAAVMRSLARRRKPESKTEDWLIFLAGTVTVTAVVALLLFACAGLLPPQPDPLTVPLYAAVFEPLGILTACTVLISLRELPKVLADPRPAFGIAALGAFLLGLLWLLLRHPSPHISPSGVTLLLSVPFCLWVAMCHRSLDGAALSLITAHAAMLVVLARAGSIEATDYVTTIIYLNMLVLICQLVHAVNLDRVRALAANAAQQRELEARVVERTARLNAMTERALAADAAKTRFLATVSHEVRTPLNGVIGMASVVLAGALDADARRNVGMIRTSGLHLLDVINRLLDYARAEHPYGPEDICTFDLPGVVEEVLGEARFSPHAEGLVLCAEIDPAVAPLRRGYRQGLRQVLTNLVGNAVKFTDRGSVTLRLLARPGDGLRIEVEDTGIGIPAEVQERIFRPFEQADASATRRHAGTGLGLAICAEIVRHMGGSIGVESAAGKGACFWVDLPLPVAAPERRPVSA